MNKPATMLFSIVLSLNSLGFTMETTQVTVQNNVLKPYINNQENQVENACQNTIDKIIAATKYLHVEIPDDGFRFNSNVPLDNDLQHFIYTTAKEYGVDYELILAMIWNESGCKVNVVGYNRNGTFDTGLMCINSSLGWSKQELLNPRKNVEIGVSMISEKIKKYGEYRGLMAYNLGDTGMKNAVRSGKTNNWYANKILKTKKLLKTKGVLY